MVVSYDSVTSAIQKLRRAFSDTRASPPIIESISKKVDRLIAPVERIEVRAPVVDRDNGLAFASSRITAHSVIRFLLILLTLGVLAAGYAFYRDSISLPERTIESKSVTGLPFANLTGDSA